MRRSPVARVCLCVASAALLAMMSTLAAKAGGGDMSVGPVSGLPVPRFVSIKPDKVNVRAGPKRDHEISWQYERSGLPVEITAESDNWRRIRDWEGSEGWVYHSMLSGRRTALVIAKDKDDLVPLYASPDATSAIMARLQPHVLGVVKECTGTWCRIAGSGFDGWIAQERLWGVYPNEKLD